MLTRTRRTCQVLNHLTIPWIRDPFFHFPSLSFTLPHLTLPDLPGSSMVSSLPSDLPTHNMELGDSPGVSFERRCKNQSPSATMPFAQPLHDNCHLPGTSDATPICLGAITVANHLFAAATVEFPRPPLLLSHLLTTAPTMVSPTTLLWNVHNQ